MSTTNNLNKLSCAGQNIDERVAPVVRGFADTFKSLLFEVIAELNLSSESFPAYIWVYYIYKEKLGSQYPIPLQDRAKFAQLFYENMDTLMALDTHITLATKKLIYYRWMRKILFKYVSKVQYHRLSPDPYALIFSLGCWGLELHVHQDNPLMQAFDASTFNHHKIQFHDLSHMIVAMTSPSIQMPHEDEKFFDRRGYDSREIMFTKILPNYLIGDNRRLGSFDAGAVEPLINLMIDYWEARQPMLHEDLEMIIPSRPITCDAVRYSLIGALYEYPASVVERHILIKSSPSRYYNHIAERFPDTDMLSELGLDFLRSESISETKKVNHAKNGIFLLALIELIQRRVLSNSDGNTKQYRQMLNLVCDTLETNFLVN